MTSNDVSFIEKLRKENVDQFFTLVRMHLSFVVDINTDDVDCSTDKPKQFRWNFHKKTKSSNSNSSHVNGGSLKNGTEANSITEDGILRLNELIDFLSKPDNVTQEGIFRRTGSLSRQQELRQLLITGTPLGLDEGKFSVHDCASVLKGFLADLPQPLLMDQYYQTYCTLASQYPPNAESSESKLLTALQLLLLLLTSSHRSFLQRLLELLRLVADNEPSNRMSPDTLATMFTPHLLCPRKLSPETFHADAIALSPVISFMIRQSARLFEPPKQLAFDAAAYCAVREKRRNDSPAKDLDESITDKTAANTVYTFVDRPRTQAENESNTTDTALAQLYAHIQALPDSQQKRKLIKHFNRQNGYGTPIQIQRTGKLAGSRSFGDSIKRHIFNKGLLNKTPKKGSGSNINTIEEKSSKAKLRFTDEKIDVSHKNIVLKNLANQIASSESLNDYDSDASNESTSSEGALNKSRKLSPKFVSEPNLSVLDGDETPKNTKKNTRLFRSKVLSASNINKKYRKRKEPIRGTPTCVSCFNDQDTASENDTKNEDMNTVDDVKYEATSPLEDKYEATSPLEDEYEATSPIQDEYGDTSSVEDTPKKTDILKINYLTSTPGVSEAIFEENCATPYVVNFRRASMSPITKSTQKLSKAMQESIMTPRSRKPLIITCEQRLSQDKQADSVKSDSFLSQGKQNAKCDSLHSSLDKQSVKCDSFQSLLHNNDSDFVSSDDDETKSDSCERSNQSTASRSDERSSITDTSLLRGQRPVLEDLNATLRDNLPQLKIDQPKALSEPFREYLLSRSVLTATPIDLSLNKSGDELTESLMYCLDGNMPSDLTLSISNLAVDRDARSPLFNLDVNIEKSPNRKRCASGTEAESAEVKKVMVDKENCQVYALRETDL